MLSWLLAWDDHGIAFEERGAAPLAGSGLRPELASDCSVPRAVTGPPHSKTAIHRRTVQPIAELVSRIRENCTLIRRLASRT